MCKRLINIVSEILDILKYLDNQMSEGIPADLAEKPASEPKPKPRRYKTVKKSDRSKIAIIFLKDKTRRGTIDQARDELGLVINEPQVTRAAIKSLGKDMYEKILAEGHNREEQLKDE